jgi:hypothetical protein
VPSLALSNDDRAFELLDQRSLGVDLLAGDRVLFEQGLEALQRDAGAVELRFVALALAAGLHQGHLKLARVYGGQQLAGLDHLAFLEQHLLKHARHLRPHPDGGLRRDGAQGFQDDGDAGFLGGGHADGGGGRAAPEGAAGAAGPAGSAAGRVRCQASQPVPARSSTAMTLPMMDARRLRRLRGGVTRVTAPSCGVSAFGSISCPWCPPSPALFKSGERGIFLCLMVAWPLFERSREARSDSAE